MVPKDPKLITAPFDGVVKRIVVNNNDDVKAKDLLVLLEDVDLINNFNLARQSLQIAEKELLRSRQFSFSNNEEKARLATLKEQEEVDNIIIETDLETKEQRIINVHGE